MDKINKKIEKVKEILKDKKIAISFSGGADSTLMIHLAKGVCDNPLAITYDNKIMPTNFLNFVKEKVDEVGISHEIIENDFMDIGSFVENNKNRCYVCRNLMYSSIKEIADEKGYDIIVDGTNISDLVEDRPGILVNYKYNIQSPFIKAGLESEEIHKYLDYNHIKYSKSTTCLGTRVKTNEKITRRKLNRISYCENIIKNTYDIEELRVREENNNVTIETPEIEKLLNINCINNIKYELKSVSYNKIFLNIGIENDNKELAMYKSCETDKSKIMFEKNLPYDLNLEKTFENIKNLGNSRFLDDIGVITLEIQGDSSKKDNALESDNSNIVLFKNGKLVGRNISDVDEAKEILIKILPLIRRSDILDEL